MIQNWSNWSKIIIMIKNYQSDQNEQSDKILSNWSQITKPIKNYHTDQKLSKWSKWTK